MVLLEKLLDITPFNQAIIFTNSVDKAIALSEHLTYILFNPITIHSGLTQEQRIENYEKFKANGSRVLIATDLFGRGIDIEKVNLVINFDLPFDVERYIHRIGRAGRFNTRGMVVSFVNEEMSIAEMCRLNDFSKRINCLIARLPQETEMTQFFRS